MTDIRGPGGPTDLIDRYVWAVTRRLPASQRADVATELRGTIADMAEARTAARTDSIPDDGALATADLRAVLGELGDPAQLARRYGDGATHLIGPRLYDDWRQLLKAMTITVLPIVAVVLTAIGILVDTKSLVEALVGAAWITFEVGIHIAFWTTLAFAIIERTGGETAELVGREREPWHPDSLEPVPATRQISLVDALLGIGFSIVAVAWLPWQHLSSPIRAADGTSVPLLDPGLWSGWIPAFAGIMALNVGLEIWKYAEQRWTLRVTVATVLLNVVMVGYFVLLTSSTELLNPDAVAHLASLGVRVEQGIVSAVVLIASVVIGVWDSVEGIVQHVRFRTRPRPDQRTAILGG